MKGHLHQSGRLDKNTLFFTLFGKVKYSKHLNISLINVAHILFYDFKNDGEGISYIYKRNI